MNAQERVAAAARARARRSRAQRAKVLNEVLVRGNRLGAELNRARLVAVIENRMRVSSMAAAEIASGVAPDTIGELSPVQVQAALALQGKSAAALEVATLEKGRAAAHAVGRVLFGGQSIGTCFMISSELLITNHHVMDATIVGSCEVEFNFEVNARGNLRPTTRFQLAPTEFFQKDPRPRMDFTVVALGTRISGTRSPADLGFCRLSAAPDKHALGDFVNIIQHAGQLDKQVVLRENMLVHRTNDVLLYNADTSGGSSGSPVFNDDWQVVAVHHNAGPTGTITLENGLLLPDTVNEGVRASRIALELLKRRGSLSAKQQAMLDRAIDPLDVPGGLMNTLDNDGDDGEPPLANAA